MTDCEAANSAISEGRLQAIFQKVSSIIKPETSFFYSEQGYRAGLFIFDMKDVSQIPQIAEPFFNELNAKVEFFPAMNQQELARGLEMWNKEAPGYSTLS